MSKSYSRSVIAGAILLTIVAPASGAEWTSSASASTSVTYTDNVCLTAEEKQGETIGRLTPGFVVNADGNRANLSLSTSLELSTLSNSKLERLGCNPEGIGNRDAFAPRLRGNADAILIENWLYIDVGATIDQNRTDPFTASGNDGLNRNGNTNTTYQYSVSPYISRRIKDLANLSVRYSFDDQRNSANIVGDSDDQSASIALTSGPASGVLSWGLQGNYSRTEFSEARNRDRDDRDNELASARFSTGYQFSSAWQINGYYGTEWNEFVSSRQKIDGNFWDAGVRWTPTSRTTVEIGSGERFFGSTPRLSINRRHKRSVFSMSFSRDLTFDRNIRASDNFFPTTDEFGQPINPTTGLPLQITGNATTRSNSPILNERLTLAYTYQGRRHTFRISGSSSDQTRTEDGGDSNFRSAAISLSRNLSRLASVSASLNWEEQAPQNTRLFNNQSETWRGQLSFERKLADNMNLSLRYSYADRQSVLANDDHQENQIVLSLSFRL